MHNTTNPWNFGNSDKQTFSPDKFYRLVYYTLMEIGMGAPFMGECYLESKDKGKIKIHEWCGGPPVWETGGGMFAIPVWNERRNQHIGVVDVMAKELRIYQEEFGVLNLRSFHKNIISSDGSPKNFDIQKESVQTLIKLVNS